MTLRHRGGNIRNRYGAIITVTWNYSLLDTHGIKESAAFIGAVLVKEVTKFDANLALLDRGCDI